jgi:RNA polymerase sigma-70 factor, ECF subfamily
LFRLFSVLIGLNLSNNPEQNWRKENIYISGIKRMAPADSIADSNDLPFSSTADAAFSARPSEIEREVMDLFDQFRNPLLRYVLSLGIPVHDAEEIIQEVFLSLFRHLQLRRSQKNLRGWIFRVAHNLTLKQRHANQKLRDQTASGWSAAEEQRDPAPNPEEVMSSAQRRRRLLAVVQALPETDQGCLRLRAEGLRYREIADALGMSLGAVSISLTRSLARLFRADGR